MKGQKRIRHYEEEAILNSLIYAETTKGRDWHIRKSLKEYIDFIIEDL